MEPLEQTPAFRLHRLHRLLRAHLLGVLADLGLTPEQFFVLMRLVASEGVPQGSLGDPDLDDRASVSRQVTLLEGRGLLQRRPHPGDGRTILVYLTPSGQDLLARLSPRVQAERVRLFGDVPAADLAIFHGVLDHLEARLLAAR